MLINALFYISPFTGAGPPFSDDDDDDDDFFDAVDEHEETEQYVYLPHPEKTHK